MFPAPICVEKLKFVVSTFKEVSVFRKSLLPSLLLNRLFLPQLAVDDIDYISAFRVSLPFLNKDKNDRKFL